MNEQPLLPENGLFFVALGGAGEIGMNLNLYKFGGKWIMVDCGLAFADETLPGVDIVVPDPKFILERSANLLGIFLTHAHEDHIGALVHIWPKLKCPIYATPFTAALITEKFQEADLSTAIALHVIPISGSVKLGQFQIQYIPVTHSIPEAHALFIKTPAGTVIHTGDWKLDPRPIIGNATDPQPFRELGDAGVMALVCDSTNVFQSGVSGSEIDVRRTLNKLVEKAAGRVVITTFASNVARIKSIMEIAEACGRHVAIVGRSLQRNIRIARAIGHLNPKTEIISEKDVGYLPPEKILLICTGCQGEKLGAISRIAFSQHAHIELQHSDLVIFSSKVIPGNEGAINRVQRQLALLGIQIITEKDHLVHTSGHPVRGDLAEMYAWTRPKLAIPVHGEFRHLREHVDFAIENGAEKSILIGNGDLVQIWPGEGEIIGQVTVGRLALDGRRLVEEDSEALKMRRRLMQNGFVIITFIFDMDGNPLVAPRVLIKGVPGTHEFELSERLEVMLHDAICGLPKRYKIDDNAIENMARRTVRQALKECHSGRPPIELDIVRLPQV